MNHEPILARPVSPVRRTWHWAQRHPWMITGAASFLVLGLVGLAYGLWQENQFLKWKSARPNEIRSQPALFVDSATVGEALVFFFLLAGMLPLMDLRARKLRGETVGSPVLWTYAVVGALQILVGLVFVLKWIEGFVWQVSHRWHWPQMALLPAFCLFWFGTIVLWKAVREHYATTFGLEILEEAEPRRRRRLNLRAVLLAGCLMGPGIVGLSFRLVPDDLYWRVTVFSLAATVAAFPLLVIAWRASGEILRPFWLFLAVNSLSFGVEYFSRLPRHLAWPGLEIGVVAGLGFVLAARFK